MSAPGSRINGNSEGDGLDTESLAQLFDQLVSTYEALEAGGEADARSVSIELGLQLCGRAQAMAGLLGLFSANEQLEDVSTEQLKYLLLPALAGYLWSQRLAGGPSQRPDSLRRCLGQYGDFLRLAGLYVVPGAPRVGEDEAAERQLAQLVSCGEGDGGAEQPDGRAGRPQPDRAKKIERLRRRKELERQLTELRPLAERPQVTEEDRRAFHLTLVERWVIVAWEEAAAAKAELPLARMLAGQERPVAGADARMSPRPPALSATHPPGRGGGRVSGAFVLTRSALEARVFGTGYPSLPTYSVEEWIDEQFRTGNFPDPVTEAPTGPPPVGGPTPESRAAERAARDAAEDAGDPQELGRLRAWDEWRDHHRRGEGNRYRKG